MSDPAALTPDFVIPAAGCADLAFARALAASMRDGSGRQNSRAFDRGGGGLNIITHASGIERAFLIADHHQQEWVRHNTVLPPARAIGRLGDHAIRERPQDCEVGDAVPDPVFQTSAEITRFESLVPDDSPPLIWSELCTIATRSFKQRTFERVRLRVTAPDQTYRDEHLWKRIE